VIGGENSRKPVFGFRLLEEKKFCKGLRPCDINRQANEKSSENPKQGFSDDLLIVGFLIYPAI